MRLAQLLWHCHRENLERPFFVWRMKETRDADADVERRGAARSCPVRFHEENPIRKTGFGTGDCFPYSIFGIGVDRMHTPRLLFHQEKATFHGSQKVYVNSENARMGAPHELCTDHETKVCPFDLNQSGCGLLNVVPGRRFPMAAPA